MKTLKHKQQIKTTMDQYSPVITIGTVVGCAKDRGENIADAVLRCSQNGDDLVFTTKQGTVLQSYYNDAEIARKRGTYENAPLLIDGEIVEIESMRYRVKYMGIRYCDPVHFIAE